MCRKKPTLTTSTPWNRNNKVDKQADEVGWWASNFTAGYISTAKYRMATLLFYLYGIIMI